MHSTPNPVKAATTSAAELVLLAAAAWMLRGYVWPTLSNTEVDTLHALSNPGVFTQDFSVQEALRFGPRTYFNLLVRLPMLAGVPLAWSFALWQLVALATIFGSLRPLARSLELGAGAVAALGTWLLTLGIGTIGGVFFYTHAPVPAVWAGALVLAGTAAAARGRVTGAFAMFGAAALLQFLVGFYAGLLALPLLWGRDRRTQGLALGAWLLGLALVYLPMRLQGVTGSELLSSAHFVGIYAYLRLPHHLVPSAWGWPVWAQLGLFYYGAWWFLERTSTGRPAGELALLRYALAVTVAALAANYLFIEVWPVALVAKLQPARITPLTQALVLLLLATRVQARVERGEWLGAVLLGLIPFTLFPGFLLALAAALERKRGLMRPPAWTVTALGVAVLLAFQPLDPSITVRAVRYALWLALFLVQFGTRRLRPRRGVMLAGALVAVAIAGVASRASQGPGWPAFLAQRFNPDAQPLDAPGRLGARFGQQAPLDAVVLIPPAGETWTFKLYAQRAVVVDDKNNPFTDRGLREWKTRMDAVLGAPLESIADPVAAWAARSPADLAAVAHRYDAHYLLTRDAWHPAIPGKKIDQQEGWTLWRLE